VMRSDAGDAEATACDVAGDVVEGSDWRTIATRQRN
jgi:hypothetical protein